MPYGLIKATHYYNKLEAWKDWKAAYEKAKSIGLEEQAIDLAPMTNWSWKKIDKQTAKLKELIDAQQAGVEKGK